MSNAAPAYKDGSAPTLERVEGPMAWRGDALIKSTEWMYQLSAAEVAELEAVGRAFLDDDPDLRTAAAQDYPLPVTGEGLRSWSRDMNHGRGFVLVRGLEAAHYSDALSAAIFFVIGLHLGEPMQQGPLDLLAHVYATSDKSTSEQYVNTTRIRDKLNFHSDSSDIVALMCLRTAKEGGASSLLSAAAVFNEVLARRPDLAPLMLEPFYFDWYSADGKPDYSCAFQSPMISRVDGVFSGYFGTRLIRHAQRYPEIPRLTSQQLELLDLVDAICWEPGFALEMDFRPGDMQWVLNYAGLHSRTAFVDFPEPQRRRHLLRLWLSTREARPLTPGFGRNAAVGSRRTMSGVTGEPRFAGMSAKFHITDAAVPRVDE